MSSVQRGTSVGTEATLDTAAQFRYAIVRAEEKELLARLRRLTPQRLELEEPMRTMLKANGGQATYDLLSGQRVTLTYDEEADRLVQAEVGPSDAPEQEGDA